MKKKKLRAQIDLDKVNRMVTSSITEFNAAMTRAAEEIPKAMIVEWQTQIVLEILARVIERTPVDTGLARGNWRVKVGSPDRKVLKQTDKTSERTFNRGAARLKKLGFGQTVWISNNLDYVIFLEGGWSRKKAPQGMVAITLQELKVGLVK